MYTAENLSVHKAYNSQKKNKNDFLNFDLVPISET